MPGIVSGVLVTLIPSVGAYLTPDLLGGPSSQMIANVIERQFKTANDWPFGAALSFLLMYMTFVAIAVQAIVSRGRVRARRHRREPPGPLDYLRRWPIRAWLAMVTVFLYAPLVTLMAFSFNDQQAQHRLARLHPELLPRRVRTTPT